MLELRDVAKHHTLGRVQVRALDGVTMTVSRGQFVALYGPSGSGKTTLLDLIAGLRMVPDSGSVIVDGRDVAMMSRREGDAYRLHQLGIIGHPRNPAAGRHGRKGRVGTATHARRAAR